MEERGDTEGLQKGDESLHAGALDKARRLSEKTLERLRKLGFPEEVIRQIQEDPAGPEPPEPNP